MSLAGKCVRWAAVADKSSSDERTWTKCPSVDHLDRNKWISAGRGDAQQLCSSLNHVVKSVSPPVYVHGRVLEEKQPGGWSHLTPKTLQSTHTFSASCAGITKVNNKNLELKPSLCLSGVNWLRRMDGVWWSAIAQERQRTPSSLIWWWDCALDRYTHTQSLMMPFWL